MITKVWPAPAKLNLFLHILERRGDGYHELQTVFQLLEYGDEISFQTNDHGRIRLETNYPDIRSDEDIIYRAASLLKETYDIRHGVNISVNKRIPVGGGLGGGSTDAATTLVALNKIWQIGLPDAELGALGLRLGADVPVFILGQSAWADGVGEKLKPLNLPEVWYLVIHPGCNVSTAHVFNTRDLTRNSAPITIRDFENGNTRNDCEAVVFRDYPQTAEAAAWLSRWTEARLTGTGACVFGRFRGPQEAKEVFDQLPPKWQGFVSKGINTSPLLKMRAEFTP